MPANRICRLADGQHTRAEHRRHRRAAVQLTQQGFDAELTELGAGRGHRGQRRIAHRRHIERAQDRHRRDVAGHRPTDPGQLGHQASAGRLVNALSRSRSRASGGSWSPSRNIRTSAPGGRPGTVSATSTGSPTRPSTWSPLSPRTASWSPPSTTVCGSSRYWAQSKIAPRATRPGQPFIQGHDRAVTATRRARRRP